MPKLAQILEQSFGTRQVCVPVFFLSDHRIKQIDSMLPWVCAVIHHKGRQNVVKTSVTHSPAARVQLHCFYHILSHLNRRTATYPASRGYIFTV